MHLGLDRVYVTVEVNAAFELGRDIAVLQLLGDLDIHAVADLRQNFLKETLLVLAAEDQRRFVWSEIVEKRRVIALKPRIGHEYRAVVIDQVTCLSQRYYGLFVAVIENDRVIDDIEIVFDIGILVENADILVGIVVEFERERVLSDDL